MAPKAGARTRGHAIIAAPFREVHASERAPSTLRYEAATTREGEGGEAVPTRGRERCPNVECGVRGAGPMPVRAKGSVALSEEDQGDLAFVNVFSTSRRSRRPASVGRGRGLGKPSSWRGWLLRRRTYVILTGWQRALELTS